MANANATRNWSIESGFAQSRRRIAHTPYADEVFGAAFPTASKLQPPPRYILLFAGPVPPPPWSKIAAELHTVPRLNANMLAIIPFGDGRIPRGPRSRSVDPATRGVLCSGSRPDRFPEAAPAIPGESLIPHRYEEERCTAALLTPWIAPHTFRSERRAARGALYRRLY